MNHLRTVLDQDTPVISPTATEGTSIESTESYSEIIKTTSDDIGTEATVMNDLSSCQGMMSQIMCVENSTTH